MEKNQNVWTKSAFTPNIFVIYIYIYIYIYIDIMKVTNLSRDFYEIKFFLIYLSLSFKFSC